MMDFKITFAPDKPSSLVGYIDSDYGGCPDSRKSTSQYYFMFGLRSISCRLKLQECTATSTIGAEYIAA